MKRGWIFFGGIVIGVMLSSACGKGRGGSESTVAVAVISEIDETLVSTASGVKIKVLKTETIGISPINRFYWLRVEGRPVKEKLLEISKIALDQIIAAKPNLYHSFTFHLISSVDAQPGVEIKKCYAKVTFLPEGDWQKVGRVPIDGYGAYKLNCTIGETR
ncbi:MAG: hypothetical protein NTW38_09120 [Candidatus Aminicenantes bacterium]|nr:hypothetical protein [Candidatus Aminicenantes bacterium]